MKKQRILSALLALCIVFSLVPTALAEKADDFTDVSRSDWYYQFVDYVTSKGYFNGTSETTFAPADNMTRAMFVTVLFRFDGAKGDRSQSAFTDVAPGEWYTDAINWAAANRIVDGVGDGKFAPNDPITRAQMCTMIERYLALYKKAWKVTLPETGSVSVMVDENAIPAYALAAVKQCQRHGLVNGFEDGTFRPNELSTRAQVAAVIYRMSYLVQGAKPDNTPSVNPGGTVNPPVNPPVTAYTYALYFDANGGTLIGASPVSTTTTSTTYSFPVSATATRDGYNFLGWATEKTATAATYPANSTITLTANYPIITLYAVWQAKAPVVVSDDLIGNAVLKSVKQVNDRFSAMKKAVVDAVDQVNKDNKYLTDAQLQQVKNIVNDMVKVEDVKANFPSDPKAEREVTWNVALEVKDGQVVSAIEQANKLANAIITGTTSKPTPDDIDGFLTSVKNAVESETGIVLTNKSLSEIKAQVVDKLKTEGKSLWANFHDGKGNYVCGNVDVVFNGKTYATVQVGANSASLSAAKSKIVKELGTAISKEIYKQMKAQGTSYTDNFTFNIDLKVNFTPAANADIKAKTDAYTYNYKLVVTPKLNSNGLLEYKYEGDENYLRLNISKDVQKAYNDGLDQIAAQFTYNDGTKDKVVAEAKKGLKDQISTLYTEVTEALDKYDITLTNTTAESIENALMPKVESWVDTNWTKIVSSTTSGGTLKGLKNDILINAVWPLIEKDIDALNVNTLIENQISEKLTEKQINEAWIVKKANESGTLKDAKDLVKGFDAVTFEPASVTLDIQSVADINFLLAQPEIKAHVTKGGFGATITLSGKGGKPFSDALKQEIVDTATKELDAALTSSATLKDLLAKNPGLKNYLIYSALVQMDLTFDTEKAANASALDNLKPTIKDEGKAKLAEKLNNKLAAIDVSSILNDGSAEKAEYQKKIDLLNSLKFDAANGIQTKTATQLADALKSPTMKDIVGNKGDEYVAQYLGKIVAKAQNLLPDSASITLNGVTLTENDLTALGNAKTSLEAVTELANLIAKFGDLSIGSFADPAGQKVTVNYNTRSASANLIINVE